MKRPDCDFIRQALRHLDRPNQAIRSPLQKKLMLESLHAPVISLWEKPFEETEPGMFCKGRKDSAEQEYELATKWLYDDFVLLSQDEWEDKSTRETGPSKHWAYFIKNLEEHPLQEELTKDAFECNWIQKVLADPDLPESKVYEANLDHFHYVLTAVSNCYDGKWTNPVVLGIHWFWLPEPGDPMYSASPDDSYEFVQSETKSTEDFYNHINFSKAEHSEFTGNAAKQLARVVDLHAYLKYGDRHAVEVLPSPEKLSKAKRNPANRNRPWNTASGPHVLLLDRMPATQKPGCGTHASPKPHRRRGHWKTLSHPRYRHHPQYQKKIYCKPSFVGPRQTTYEGNIYRLVQPLEEAIHG